MRGLERDEARLDCYLNKLSVCLNGKLFKDIATVRVNRAGADMQ